MIGPEHYRRAESLLLQAATDTDLPDATRAFMAHAAQVHATLALAAATAEVEPVGEWAKACGVPLTGGGSDG